MKFAVLLAATALVAAVSASDVLVFTDADFKDSVAEHEVALVEFYAPWCGHCKKLAPEYEEAATKLKTNDPPVALAKVDCTVEKATCDKHGVSGFPTLKIFRNGEFSADYQGPREAGGIVKYMRGQVGPSSKELKSLADFEKFLENEEHSVVGLFEGDSKLRDSYLKVADTERDRFRFAHSSNKKVLEKTGFNDDIVIYAPKRLHSKFEETHTRYDGNYDTDKIKKFLENQMHGLAGHRTPDNTWQFNQRPLVVVYYNVDYVKDPKGTNYWRNRVLKVAKEQKKMHFAIASKNDFGQELDAFGLSDKKDQDKPLVAAMGPIGEKYPMEEEFSVESLTAFVKTVLDGKAEQYMKSEDVPSEQGNVKVAVAKNFKDVVPEDKDALIEFYAPWCGHCKKLAPIWDELGDKLAKEDVNIVKMDATANDVPGNYQVQGFPTIYWKPANGQPRQYQGGRDLKDFIKYIAKEATTELKKYGRDGSKKKKSEL